MPTPSQVVKTRPTTGNPFVNIPNFTCLEQSLDTEGKQLPQVIDSVAEHMMENNISHATVVCRGMSGKSLRHFVNLSAMKKLLPEEFKNVSPMHPLVHMESRSHPNIVVLKAGATSRLFN